MDTLFEEWRASGTAELENGSRNTATSSKLNVGSGAILGMKVPATGLGKTACS
jgi:hypothetical protein